MTWLAIGCSQAASPMAPVPTPAAGQQVAVFAGGCFWCIESDFDKMPGVVSTTSGFGEARFRTRPTTRSAPTAPATSRSRRSIFDPKVTPYEKVLDYYWHHVDPTDAGGQFCDCVGDLPDGDIPGGRRTEEGR